MGRMWIAGISCTGSFQILAESSEGMLTSLVSPVHVMIACAKPLARTVGFPSRSVYTLVENCHFGGWSMAMEMTSPCSPITRRGESTCAAIVAGAAIRAIAIVQVSARRSFLAIGTEGGGEGIPEQMFVPVPMGRRALPLPPRRGLSPRRRLRPRRGLCPPRRLRPRHGLFRRHRPCRLFCGTIGPSASTCPLETRGTATAFGCGPATATIRRCGASRMTGLFAMVAISRSVWTLAT